MARRVATIGVYGFDRDTFLAALSDAGVELVLDVRQRRGVRGAQYAWANSKRLQAALAEAGIAYEHRPELAPTTALRQLQYAEDDRRGVGKRNREELAEAYVAGYTEQILDPADLDAVLELLPEKGAAALLCVERDPEACHRSLVAERLAEEGDVTVEHLKPGLSRAERLIRGDVSSSAHPCSGYPRDSERYHPTSGPEVSGRDTNQPLVAGNGQARPAVASRRPLARPGYPAAVTFASARSSSA